MLERIKKFFRKKKLKVKKKLNLVKTVPLNSLSFYICNACGEKITREELDRTWDWSGPHCPNCGNTGMDMLSNVIEQESPKGI